MTFAPFVALVRFSLQGTCCCPVPANRSSYWASNNDVDCLNRIEFAAVGRERILHVASELVMRADRISTNTFVL